MSYTKDLIENKILTNPPKWLKSNIIFEGMTGSVAYGVSGESSDIDIIAICIPLKEMIFPHLSGEIDGFGTPSPRFNVFQQHHLFFKNKEIDITIYSIVKYFNLVMENNPNMIDSLFIPRRCVLHSTQIYEYLRENRKIFLNKKCWHTFRGYAYAQLTKIKNKNNSSNLKRKESIEKFGFDLKFAYHVVRLLLEVEQILSEGDLNIEQNSDILKSIRNGEWTLERIEEWFSHKEKCLESLYSNSSIPNIPKESSIKNILLNCLEMHFGNLDTVIQKNNEISELINDLENVIYKYKQ